MSAPTATVAAAAAAAAALATKADVTQLSDRLSSVEHRMIQLLAVMEKMIATANGVSTPHSIVSPMSATSYHAAAHHAASLVTPHNLLPPPLPAQMSTAQPVITPPPLLQVPPHSLFTPHGGSSSSSPTTPGSVVIHSPAAGGVYTPSQYHDAVTPASTTATTAAGAGGASIIAPHAVLPTTTTTTTITVTAPGGVVPPERSVSPPVVPDPTRGAGPRRGSLSKLHAVPESVKAPDAPIDSLAPATTAPAAAANGSASTKTPPKASAAATAPPAIPALAISPGLAKPLGLTRLDVKSPNHALSAAVRVGWGGNPEAETPTSADRRKSVVSSLKKKNFLAVFRTTVIQAAKKQEMARHLPPTDHPEYFFRLNWVTSLNNNAGMVAPDFVAQMGKVVHLVDIRFANDVIEPLGYIPGVDWVPKFQIEILARELAHDACVVLISADDSDARVAAKTLNALGMPFACAMRGGMKDWKFMGFQTSRDKSILTRQGQLRKNEADKKKKAGEATARSEAVSASAAAAALSAAGSGGDTKSAAAATPVVVDAKSALVSLAEIKSHIGDPLNIQWLKLAAFLLHARQSCVDGRDDSGVIGTPGGDMGEFVLSLTVLEQLSGKNFSLSDVERLLRRRLEAFGRFYMHTDVTALERLQSAFRSDPRLSPVMTPIMKAPLEYRAFMRSPPAQYRAAIMEHQLNSAHFGCGHLRLLLTKSKEYKVRTQLVLDALHCFFTARWNGAIECEYMALSGQHNEGAVVTVYLDTKVASFTTIPLISPSCDGKQIFVNHPQVSSFLRQQHGLFYTGQTDMVNLSEAARDEYVARVEGLAALHATKTLGYLANGLPCYKTKFQKPLASDHNSSTEIEHPFTVALEGVIGAD